MLQIPTLQMITFPVYGRFRRNGMPRQHFPFLAYLFNPNRLLPRRGAIPKYIIQPPQPTSLGDNTINPPLFPVECDPEPEYRVAVTCIVNIPLETEVLHSMLKLGGFDQLLAPRWCFG